MFNLEWYRIFMHTARHRNLSKAAAELHITQPSVSYAIKQMEEALGLKLFHRLSKGVELTEEGQALFEYVEQSFTMLDSAQKHLENLKQLNEGEIRIGASDYLIKHLLLPQLNTFHLAEYDWGALCRSCWYSCPFSTRCSGGRYGVMDNQWK